MIFETVQDYLFWFLVGWVLYDLAKIFGVVKRKK
jgi:hypothetical protein